MPIRALSSAVLVIRGFFSEKKKIKKKIAETSQDVVCVLSQQRNVGSQPGPFKKVALWVMQGGLMGNVVCVSWVVRIKTRLDETAVCLLRFRDQRL